MKWAWLALLLAGCGACDSTEYAVSLGAPDDYLLGSTSCGGIELSPSLGYEFQVAVLRHEIGHALGMGHAADESCVMYYGVRIGSPSLCAPVPAKPVTIISGDFYDAALEAASWWNERGAFVEVR